MQDTAGEAGTNFQWDLTVMYSYGPPHMAGQKQDDVMYSYEPPHMAGQKQDDQLEHTFSSYVRIRDVTLKTCQRRWTIGRSGERGSGISVLAARHDDDEACLSKTLNFLTVLWFYLFLSNTYKYMVSRILFLCISSFLGYLMSKPFS